VPKLATPMDSAEQDVLTCMTFPRQHWTKLHSTNPIERLNGEIKRRTEVVGIFPNDDAIVRLVGALSIRPTIASSGTDAQLLATRLKTPLESKWHSKAVTRFPSSGYWPWTV